MSWHEDEERTGQVTGMVLRRTSLAVLVLVDTINDNDSYCGEEIWFPLSVVEAHPALTRGVEGTFDIREWFLEKGGYA